MASCPRQAGRALLRASISRRAPVWVWVLLPTCDAPFFFGSRQVAWRLDGWTGGPLAVEEGPAPGLFGERGRWTAPAVLYCSGGDLLQVVLVGSSTRTRTRTRTTSPHPCPHQYLTSPAPQARGSGTAQARPARPREGNWRGGPRGKDAPKGIFFVFLTNS